MSTLALTPLGIADRIIELVRASAPGDDGVETSDRNDRLLVAAYGRAFRCLVSIRDLAAHGELIGPVVLEKPESEKADDVLIRAALTYGVFLEKSEPVVGHGLTREVRKLLVDYFNAQTTASSAA